MNSLKINKKFKFVYYKMLSSLVCAMKSATKIYSFYLGRAFILKTRLLEYHLFHLSIYLLRLHFIHISTLLTHWTLHRTCAQYVAPSVITANPLVTEVFQQ